MKLSAAVCIGAGGQELWMVVDDELKAKALWDIEPIAYVAIVGK